MPKIVENRDEGTVRTIDAECKNKFRWEWLEKQFNNIALGDFIKKIDIPGKALCTVCNDIIFYGTRGRKALESHAESKKHNKLIQLQRKNYSISSAYILDSDSSKPSTSLTENSERPNATGRKINIRPVIPISDRIANQQVN